MKKICITSLSLILLLTTLTGCLIKTTTRIYVTNYPMQYLAESIGGAKVEVINVSDGNLIQTAHFKKEYLNDFNKKDLFVYIQDLESYMPIYLEAIREKEIEVFDASLHATSERYARYSTVTASDLSTSVTIQTPYYSGAAFDSMDLYVNDPFLWMDPLSMMGIAEALAEKMKMMDPVNKRTYERNLETLKASLARLDAEYNNFKHTSGNRKVATITNSYGNWQKAYYVHIYPVMVSKYGLMPTEAQYQLIKERLIKDEVKYIADEPNLTDGMRSFYERLRDELGLMPIDLHNLSALLPIDISNNKDYLEIMYENLANLKLIQ